MQILPVETAAQVEEVRSLLEEYWASFGFTPCFQNFDAEVAGLPGAYCPPDGRLALALVDRAAAGCIALRPVDSHCARPSGSTCDHRFVAAAPAAH